MGVYHITYTPGLKEICLYLDEGCQLSCHGCITNWHPKDYHLEEDSSSLEHRIINIDKVIGYLKTISFEKVIFLGKEPTVDKDFLPLARILKKRFATYNVFLTNGLKYIDDKALDEVCISIKAITPRVFKEFTGKDRAKEVLENFKIYTRFSHMKVRAESVFVPGLIDIDEIEKIAKFIAEIDPDIPYRIDGYIPYSEDDKSRRPTKVEMEKAKKISERYLKSVSILHYGVKVKYRVERVY